MEAIVSESTTTTLGAGAATFTKWMVGEGPDMAGVVGGSVGEGVYLGKVLDMNPGPTTTVEARYEFQGSERQFAALVHVEQTGLKAVVNGVVIDGWGKGRQVTGEYTEIQCRHDGVTTDCWQGSLTVGDAPGD
jgi:hypothetical protein